MTPAPDLMRVADRNLSYDERVVLVAIADAGLVAPGLLEEEHRLAFGRLRDLGFVEAVRLRRYGLGGGGWGLSERGARHLAGLGFAVRFGVTEELMPGAVLTPDETDALDHLDRFSWAPADLTPARLHRALDRMVAVGLAEVSEHARGGDGPDRLERRRRWRLAPAEALRVVLR